MNNYITIVYGIILVMVLSAPTAPDKKAQTDTQVTITGKIVFNNQKDNNDYGLYGNHVYLYFHNTYALHGEPELLDINDNTLGQTYAILNEKGEFTFDFTTDKDLSGYNEVIVRPAAENAAAKIEPTGDGGGGGGPCGGDPEANPPIEGCTERPATPPGGSGPVDIVFLNEVAEAKAMINGSSSVIDVITSTGEVSSGRGIAFRGLMLAREYLMERYPNTPSYGVPQLPLKFDLGINDDDEGQFRQNEFPVEIGFRPLNLELTTVAHEYGHYVHYQMWNGDPSRFNNLDSDEQGLIEGWGQFYSFAVRNWANGTPQQDGYGDPLEESEDNLEEGPFRPTPYSSNAYSFGSSANPKVPRAASYLWNVHDGTQMGVFKADRYGSADNDDVGGDPLRVFTVMENITDNNKTLADFHSDFKSGRSQALKNSLDDIKNFTDDPTSYNMRPVPTKNVSAQLHSNSIDFSWDSQSYASSADYRNDGGAYYELWLNNNGGWELLATQISFNATSFTYNYSSIESGDYYIKSYNSAGEALGSSSVYLGASAPTGLEVTNENAIFGGPRLDWNDNPEPIDNYKVYRHWPNAPATKQTIAMLGTPTASEFVDVNVAISGDSETFYYYVFAVKGGFVSEKSNTVSILGDDASPFKRAGDGESTIQEAVPTAYGMGANYPNPFNPTTVLAYDLPEAAQVSLEVYNILGRKVQTLVSTVQAAGSYEASFNASRLSNGVYIARLKAKGQSGKTFVREQKMTLIK